MNHYRRTPSQSAYARAEVTISRYTLSASKRAVPFRTCVCLLLVLAAFSIVLTIHVQFNVREARNLRREKQNRFRSSVFNYRRSTAIWEAPSRTNGISIVAACKNAHGKLKTSVPSWLRLAGLDEIIIVDWTSTPPLHYAIEEIDNIDRRYVHTANRGQPKLTVVTVQKESSWIPSHAYNIGFRFAKSDRILRVDCDHSIRPSFLNLHRLTKDNFYTGSLQLSREDTEVDLEKVLYIHRDALESVGGYDERIDGFGGEHADLVNRLTRGGFKKANINYDSFLHQDNGLQDNVQSNDSSVSQFQSDVADIEKEVNLRLVASSPPWNATNAAESFVFDLSRNTTIPSFRHANARYVIFKASSHTPSLQQTTSSSQLKSQKEFIIAKFINQQYDVPHCLLELISLSDRLNMLRVFSRLAQRQNGIQSRIQRRNSFPRAMFIFASRSLIERLTLVSSALSFTRQTGRPLLMFWPLPDDGERIISTGASYTSFNKLFIHADLAEDVAIFDNIDVSSSFCKKNGRVDDTKFYTYFEGDGQPKPIIHKDVNYHIAIHANTYIKAESVHLSNAKTMRMQLQRLSVHPDITSKILPLENLGLSKCLGVYIPSKQSSSFSSQEPIKHTDALHYFTTIHDKVSSELEEIGPNKKACVYLDTDYGFSQRLRSIQDVDWLPTLRYPAPSCQNVNGTSTCFVNDLARIVLLSKTKSFYSPVDDEFSNFIKMFRAEVN